MERRILALKDFEDQDMKDFSEQQVNASYKSSLRSIRKRKIIERRKTKESVIILKRELLQRNETSKSLLKI